MREGAVSANAAAPTGTFPANGRGLQSRPPSAPTQQPPPQTGTPYQPLTGPHCSQEGPDLLGAQPLHNTSGAWPVASFSRALLRPHRATRSLVPACLRRTPPPPPGAPRKFLWLANRRLSFSVMLRCHLLPEAPAALRD